LAPFATAAPPPGPDPDAMIEIRPV